MDFEKCDIKLSAADIEQAESRLGFALPEEVRITYLSANGGKPQNSSFAHPSLETVVTRFLPLESSKDQWTAVFAYARLVRELHLCPDGFLPFAQDGGGDFFFVDCQSTDSRVYFYRSDTAFEHVLDLAMSFKTFWESLTEAEESW
jgi:cell wall assembly regulator SMI1